jgi:hypothetical protein
MIIFQCYLFKNVGASRKVKIQDILNINKIARIFTSEVHNRKTSVAVVFWYKNRVASVEFKCFAFMLFLLGYYCTSATCASNVQLVPYTLYR